MPLSDPFVAAAVVLYFASAAMILVTVAHIAFDHIALRVEGRVVKNEVAAYRSKRKAKRRAKP